MWELIPAPQQAGVRVWHNGFELKINGSLRRKIDKGLANSCFGVIVFSRALFGKDWTNIHLL